MHGLTRVAATIGFATATATAIGGTIALLREERTAVTSEGIESFPAGLMTASWFVSVLVLVVVTGWFGVLAIGILRRRRWARPAGMTTFAVGALVALVIAIDVDPEKAVGTVDPVEGAGAPGYAVAVLNAVGAVLLLLPQVRADFTDAWLGRLGPERRAAIEARRNYRWDRS